jgi:phosphoribosylformylglycinamidine synthase
LIDGRKNLADYQIMAFPGGFAHGDDTGSGNAYAAKMRNNLWDDVLKFVKEDKLVIGICNGCQIIANLGLIPGLDGNYGDRTLALMHNATARYECRWIDMKTTSKKCVWTQNMESLHCPVSHGEGRFFAEQKIVDALIAGDQIALKYVKPDGTPANGEFPFNPNGAMLDIAAVCDPTGRILGIMPHPERNWNFYNEDDWTLIKEKALRGEMTLPQKGQGMKIFENAVAYFSAK